MCVLCWQFLTESHWTDWRFEATDSTTATAGSDDERARRRDRYHRIQILNQLLAHYGLRLDDWHSRSYLLSDRKGKTAIVHDLGTLWPTAQQLAGRPLDPLDPEFLARLSPPHAARESGV